VLQEENDHIDVRFFGEHDRWVVASHLFAS